MTLHSCNLSLINAEISRLFLPVLMFERRQKEYNPTNAFCANQISPYFI